MADCDVTTTRGDRQTAGQNDEAEDSSYSKESSVDPEPSSSQKLGGIEQKTEAEASNDDEDNQPHYSLEAALPSQDEERTTPDSSIPNKPTAVSSEAIQPVVDPSDGIQPTAVSPEAIQPVVDPSDGIQPTAVSPEAIQPTAVPPEHIQPTAVPPEVIQSAAVSRESIQPLAISSEAIQPIALSPEAIQPIAVSPETFQPLAVSSETIQPTAVSREAIQPLAVSSETIQPTAVSPETIQPLAVSSETIQPTAVSPETIQPLAVSSETIQPTAVSREAIQPTAVSSEAIQPSAVAEVLPSTDYEIRPAAAALSVQVSARSVDSSPTSPKAQLSADSETQPTAVSEVQHTPDSQAQQSIPSASITLSSPHLNDLTQAIVTPPTSSPLNVDRNSLTTCTSPHLNDLTQAVVTPPTSLHVGDANQLPETLPIPPFTRDVHQSLTQKVSPSSGTSDVEQTPQQDSRTSEGFPNPNAAVLPASVTSSPSFRKETEVSNFLEIPTRDTTDSTTMAGTQGRPPPCEEKAVCKYRWGKAVPTSSPRIIFFSSACPKEPVFLHWSPHAEAYFSDERHVPCGEFAGYVIVEGKTHPVEAYIVRPYTFEVDLFLKEDIIEDQVAASNTLTQELKFQQQQLQGPVDTYRDIITSAFTTVPKMEDGGGAGESGIRHNSKYADLLRQQLQHKESLDANLENELIMSLKSDHVASGSGSKRLTPLGDIDKEPFQDSYNALPVGTNSNFEPSLSGCSSGRHSPQNVYPGSVYNPKQDYDADRHSVKSGELNSNHQSIRDALLSDTGINKFPSRAGSTGSNRPSSHRELYENGSGSRPGSARRTPVDIRIDDVLSGPGSRSSSTRQTPTKETIGDVLSGPGSRSSSTRQTPTRETIGDVLSGPGSRSSSTRQTPTRETIGDVLGSDAFLAIVSPARSHTSGSARQTPEKDTNLIGSGHSSSRNTPRKESMSSGLRGSQERLGGSHQELDSLGEQHPLTGSRPPSQQGSISGSRSRSVSSSRLGSSASSRVGGQLASRTHSLTSLSSEQELAQLMDTNNSQTSSELQHTPLIFDTHPDESTMLPAIMRDRPSSLPAYSTQALADVDRRSYTPDKAWLSKVGARLEETGFQRDLFSRMMPKSAVSSHTSSRTVTPVSAGGSREQENTKVHDLEETVATLRKLLSSREQEVHELMAQLRDLKDINQSLQKDLEHARSRRTPTGPDEVQHQYQQVLQEKDILAAEVVKLRDKLETNRGMAAESFSSRNAASMQKRIEELEAHIRDLRHTNESALQKLLRSEQHVKELQEEKDKLRSSNVLNAQEYKNDRSNQPYLIEMQQLKEDVRTLRDRNFTLQEENLKLKDGKGVSWNTDYRSRESRTDLTQRNPISSQMLHRTDVGIFHKTESSSLSDCTRPAVERTLFKHLPMSDQLISSGSAGMRKHLDRGYRSDSSPTIPSRDMPQRSFDHNFGSDPHPGKRDAFREVSTYSRRYLESGSKDHGSNRFGKYAEYSADHGIDLRKTDPGRYDFLRSRPDGEVSEKLCASDPGKYGTFSTEKLHTLDREREHESGRVKPTMSAERLRILEEAERNRERKNLTSSDTADHRTFSAARIPFSEKDKQQQRKPETNLSDDSDSTAVLMSYDTKFDMLPGRQHDQEKSSYSKPSRPQNTYYDRFYTQEKDLEKEREKELRGGNLHGSYRETAGEDSDTATDILLSAEAGRVGSRPLSPRRLHQASSFGDDVSLSSFSDPDEPPDSLRRRSKSVDNKGKKGSSRRSQTSLLRTAASTEMIGGNMPLSSGFRSVTSKLLATQHNRNTATQQQASLSSSLTQGLRPFAPRSPGDVRIEDVVKFSRQGGKLSQGIVKFVGHLPGRTDVYLGVELYKEEGKHDGTFEAVRYFKCKPNKGVFVAFNKVVMAWAPS